MDASSETDHVIDIAADGRLETKFLGNLVCLKGSNLVNAATQCSAGEGASNIELGPVDVLLENVAPILVAGNADQAMVTQYLTNHATCWCLASPESKYQFAMGLTCMWRTGFELWRGMYDPIVGRPPSNQAIECCWLIREWISIAERFLVKTERAWSGVRNPNVVARLSSRMTIDALVRHYALLVSRLERRIAYAREPLYLHGPADLYQLIDTSYQPAMYLLKLNANRNAVTLIIDDDQVNLAKMTKLAKETAHDVDHLRTHAEDPH